MLPATMRAMVLRQAGTPLGLEERPVPAPGAGQVLVRVAACGVCRTDLHVVDGELTEPKLPLVPGHEVVGHVAGLGEGVERFDEGTRVGVPWLGWTCDQCRFCRAGRENLCEAARFTGYTLDGGYAEFLLADQHYCFPLAE
ncbi:MAG: alcohol dehydrogenase catalytic domain-containing protein, partial [Rhodospirillales bacterium]|nr:alcohol dehydrogenase catalytic domain-containing protein [Rhodospirillales bacterium]